MSKLLDKQSLDHFEELINKYYEEEKNYAGWILYEWVIKAHKKDEKLYNKEFLKKIYVTLCWFMKRRIKKVIDFKKFSDSICKPKNKKLLDKLSKKRLECLKEGEVKETLLQLRTLLKKIKVMDSDSKLVSVSKTLHFLLPNLVMPMDDTFTSKIKKGGKGYFGKKIKEIYKGAKKKLRDLKLRRDMDLKFRVEFNEFCRYFLTSQRIAQELQLSKRDLVSFNGVPIPKLIDNAIIENGKEIGEKKENEKRK